jgi:murein DD-endopeptidase MepM/ murein hydrolase activator NlpD
MRCVVEPGRSLQLLRLAMLATIAVALVSCSADTQRFEINPFRSKAPSNEITGSVPSQKHASVQSQPLPPPTGVPQTRPAVTGKAGGSPGMASYEPGQSRDITGSASKHGWNWNGGTAIIVHPGDTIDGLVHRYGVPASAIAEANNLANGRALRPGQRLVIPKYETTGSTTPHVASNAPHKPVPAVSVPATTGPLVHVVEPGETLMALSRKYHKSLAEIAKANKIPAGTMVKVGDRITIPGVHALQQQQPAAPQKVAAIPAAPATTPSANVLTPVAQHPEPEKAKHDVTAAMPSFRWPVRGRVIAGFGPKPSGQQNDGINVAVPEGTPIKAADDGVVAYAGNELKTYGNLVLVRHANGYVTAYAHASEILVKRDDPVKRGQVIAKAGQTGTVAAPQLHFEIRKGSTPVDPAPFLDKGGNG